MSNLILAEKPSLNVLSLNTVLLIRALSYKVELANLIQRNAINNTDFFVTNNYFFWYWIMITKYSQYLSELML